MKVVHVFIGLKEILFEAISQAIKHSRSAMYRMERDVMIFSFQLQMKADKGLILHSSCKIERPTRHEYML